MSDNAQREQLTVSVEGKAFAPSIIPVTTKEALKREQVRCYSNIGKPFKWGEHVVCHAMETLAHIGSDTALTRRVILDIETGEEIDLLDIGSHVVYNPHPGQAYTVHPVVDAEVQE